MAGLIKEMSFYQSTTYILPQSQTEMSILEYGKRLLVMSCRLESCRLYLHKLLNISLTNFSLLKKGFTFEITNIFESLESKGKSFTIHFREKCYLAWKFQYEDNVFAGAQLYWLTSACSYLNWTTGMLFKAWKGKIIVQQTEQIEIGVFTS